MQVITVLHFVYFLSCCLKAHEKAHCRTEPQWPRVTALLLFTTTVFVLIITDYKSSEDSENITVKQVYLPKSHKINENTQLPSTNSRHTASQLQLRNQL